MEYVPPGDGSGNDSYSDGSPGVEGSIVSDEAIEHPMREIVNAISASGQTPSGADLTQLAQAIALSAQLKTVSLSSSQLLQASHRDRLIFASNGITLTLPAATPSITGWTQRIRNQNTGGQVVTIASAGGSLVLPRAVVSSLKLPERGDTIYVVCDGTHWQVMSYSALSYVELQMSASQQIAEDTDTKVLFDTKVFDSLGDFNVSNKRIQPIVPGLYDFLAQVRFDQVPDGTVLRLDIRKNGLATTPGGSGPQLSVGRQQDHSAVVSAKMLAAAGDYFEAWVVQDSQAGPQLIESPSHLSYFRAVRIG